MSRKHNNTRTLCELCNDDGKTDNLCRPCKSMIDKRRKEIGVEGLGCQGDIIDDTAGLEETSGEDHLHETNVYCKLKRDPSNNSLYAETISNPIPVDELHNKRQVGKAFVGPALLMELFGYMLQIGKEKGYKDGSWEQYIHDGHDVIPSIKRHLVGSEKAIDDGWYTERKPDGTPCPTRAHHDYALFWNAAIRALQRYHKDHKK